MDSQQLIYDLDNFRNRLSDVSNEVFQDFRFGQERWGSFVRSIRIYFDKNLSSYKTRVESIIFNQPSVIELDDPDFLRFRKNKVFPMDAFLRSLILDIEEGVANLSNIELSIKPNCSELPIILLKKAFIVHGRDDATKERTARFLEKLGFKAVILHEQASGGKTIIEKLEHFTDVGFGIVLYTPDDIGEAIAKKDQLRSRARQNVVFEHGLLIGKVGRERVFPLVTDHSIELPSDISGMVYLSDNSWEFQLAKEIRALGYEVDLNNL